MKKTYTTPQATTVLLVPSTVLALSGIDETIHNEYNDNDQLSNERSWSSESWSEE